MKKQFDEVKGILRWGAVLSVVVLLLTNFSQLVEAPTPPDTGETVIIDVATLNPTGTIEFKNQSRPDKYLKFANCSGNRTLLLQFNGAESDINVYWWDSGSVIGTIPANQETYFIVSVTDVSFINFTNDGMTGVTVTVLTNQNITFPDDLVFIGYPYQDYYVAKYNSSTRKFLNLSIPLSDAHNVTIDVGSGAGNANVTYMGITENGSICRFNVIEVGESDTFTLPRCTEVLRIISPNKTKFKLEISEESLQNYLYIEDTLAEIQVKAQSQNNSNMTDTITSLTRVKQFADVDVLSATGNSAYPGESVNVTFPVVNWGNGEDTFSLSLSSQNGWTSSFTNGNNITDKLSPGEQCNVEVTVVIPINSSQITDTITLEATSIFNSSISDSANVEITALRIFGLTVETPSGDKDASAGESILYVVNITNNGNFPDSFSLNASSLNDWNVTIGPLDTIITPGINFAYQWCRIALDKYGNPHISYYNGDSYDLMYAHWDGIDWVNETADATDDVGRHSSIEIDDLDNVHISYYDKTNGNLNYIIRNASTRVWASPVAVDSGGDVGGRTDLTLDTNGNPHITYYDKTNKNLKYAVYTGSVWDVSTVESSGDVGRYNSITTDAEGDPHIAYYSFNDYGLKYAEWTGSSWSKETVHTGTSYRKFIFPAIVLDSNEYPHIIYYNDYNTLVKYAKWTGSQWVKETLDNTDDVGLWTSMTIDADDNLYASYYDTTNDDLKYARYDSGTSSWSFYIVDDPAAENDNVGLYTSIAVDDHGQPHIVYKDIDSNQLLYARAPSLVGTGYGISPMIASGATGQVNVTVHIPNDAEVGTVDQLSINISSYNSTSYHDIVSIFTTITQNGSLNITYNGLTNFSRYPEGKISLNVTQLC